MTALTIDEALDRARVVVRDVVAPAAETVDREARWPAEGIAALQEAGLAGLVVPVEHGGLGLGAEGLMRVGEVIGRACPSTALCFGMHSVAAATIAADATPWQAKHLLGPIAAGEHLTTLALSETGTGAHFWLPSTTLREDGGHLRLRGTKAFVTNGAHADSYVVSTVDGDPSAPPGRFSCVVVPRDSAGMVWNGEWHGLGMRGNSSQSVRLDEVEVPRDHLLGNVGDEIRYVFGVIAPYFLVAMAGTYLGIADAALSVAIEHLRGRSHEHTARTLADSTLLQHRVGSLWGVVERARQLSVFAARAADTGAPEALPALCSAKADVAEAVTTVVNEAMTMVGGIAYRDGSPLERHLRDARAAHVMSPTTDLLRIWTGRVALGRPLLGDL